MFKPIHRIATNSFTSQISRVTDRFLSMSSENSLVVNKKGKYNIVLDDFKKNIPESVLFDSTGKRLTYKKEEQDCNAGLFATIPELTINSSLKEEKGRRIIVSEPS